VYWSLNKAKFKVENLDFKFFEKIFINNFLKY
jgi:hypothetical protein